MGHGLWQAGAGGLGSGHGGVICLGVWGGADWLGIVCCQGECRKSGAPGLGPVAGLF